MNTLHFRGYGYFMTENTSLFTAVDEFKNIIQNDASFEIELNMVDFNKNKVKNDLFFAYDNGSYKTNKSTLREAAIELIKYLKTKNINITLDKTTLKDQNGNTIEEISAFFE